MLQCATNAGKKEDGSEEQSNKDNGKSKRTLGRFFLFLGVFLCILGILLYLFNVTVVTDSYTYELGSNVSTDISDYILGKDFAVKFAHLDISNVNEKKPGVYNAYVDYLFKTFSYTVTIEDTIAPVVSFNTENYACEVNKELDASDFVQDVSDESSFTLRYINVSSDSDIDVKDDGTKISVNSCGVHNIDLRAEDEYGNFNDYFLSIVADTAPVIEGNMNYITATGTLIDLTEGVTAFDDMDGNLSSEVTATVLGDYTKKAGNYVLEYDVTDSLGLTGFAFGTIYSFEPLVLQDYVNTGKVDPFADNVYGVINPYDCGYLEDGDMEKAIEKIKPSVVRIHYETATTLTNGSGYIIKIDDKEVIVCTNRHVVSNRDTVTISLYDGTNVKGTVVARQTSPDIAFVKIEKSDIPSGKAEDIKTIHINYGYYEELSSKPSFDMGIYCINEDGSEWVEGTGKIVNKSGKLSVYYKDYDYPVTEVSVKLRPGVSGSAIVDEHGNLICMASFYWVHDGTTSYYGVSLDDILDYYEKVFGERLEYY